MEIIQVPVCAFSGKRFKGKVEAQEKPDNKGEKKIMYFAFSYFF